MTDYLDKNSKIKSSLNLKNDNILNSDEIDKIKPLIVDTQTINEYYFKKESIEDDKTYELKDGYQDLSYSFDCRKKEGFEGESFLTYPQNKYEDLTIKVSNFGRIRINGEIAEQVEKYVNKKKIQNEKDIKIQVGYLQLKYSSENENIKKAWDVIKENYIYDMVAKIWLWKPDDEGWRVHHITNNGYDNRVENLIWVKESDHREIHRNKTVK
jgi:hypothetical protein